MKNFRVITIYEETGCGKYVMELRAGTLLLLRGDAYQGRIEDQIAGFFRALDFLGEKYTLTEEELVDSDRYYSYSLHDS